MEADEERCQSMIISIGRQECAPQPVWRLASSWCPCRVALKPRKWKGGPEPQTPARRGKGAASGVARRSAPSLTTAHADLPTLMVTSVSPSVIVPVRASPVSVVCERV